MGLQRVVRAIADEQDRLAEADFPTSRAAYSSEMATHYMARGRDMRAAAFMTVLRWLMARLCRGCQWAGLLFKRNGKDTPGENS